MIHNNVTSPSGLYLLVGDIHGDVLSLQRAIKYGEEHDAAVIFVGDYVDGHIYTRGEQLKALKIVSRRSRDDNLYFIKGNHDISYMKHPQYTCWGYSSDFHRKAMPYFNHANLHPFVTIGGNILITHGGLSKSFMEKYTDILLEGTDNQMLEAATNYMRRENTEQSSDLFRAGEASEGRLDVGGPFWCRPKKFIPFGEDILQVFGHTSSHSVDYLNRKRAFNIDALAGHERQALLYEEQSETFSVLSLLNT